MIGLITSTASSLFNNRLAQGREDHARAENAKYNELAAENADRRTRSLYNDLYSPQAQLQQIKNAGLSPSVFFGSGAVGQSGQAGAQGNGAGNISPNVFGIDVEKAASIDLMKAQADNLNADTRLKDTNNRRQEIAEEMDRIEFNLYSIDASALEEYVVMNGKRLSISEYADTCTSYEKFISGLREMGISYNLVNTEEGQRVLRTIFKANRELKTELAILSEEDISANFQQSIINELKKVDFAKESAEAQVAQLRANVQTNELTESQKEAWNSLLDALEKKFGSWAKNAAIIFGQLFRDAAVNYKPQNWRSYKPSRKR